MRERERRKRERGEIEGEREKEREREGEREGGRNTEIDGSLLFQDFPPPKFNIFSFIEFS